jgi:hypothetical protein
MKCTYTDGEQIHLCPDCLKADGSFCLGCGEFCAGMTSFDFIHPGFCDNCWDEIESDDWDADEYDADDIDAWPQDDDDDYDEEDFRNGSLDY